MIFLLVVLYRLVVFPFLLTGCSQWIRLGRGFKVSKGLRVGPLIQWEVACAMTNSLPILKIRIAMIATLLMCLWLPTLTFLQIFPETLAPLASYVVQPMLPFLRPRAVSLALHCQIKKLLQSATLRWLPTL